MRVGLIGLGDIAQKAYLPVIGTRDDVTLHLCTRNEKKLHALGETYRIDVRNRHNELESLMEAGVDAVFVHAATPAHYEIVKRVLTAGLHVFVDKPVDYALGRTEELMALAEENKQLLMVGFNRRYVPTYRQVHEEGIPDIAMMQKNRVNLPGEVRTFVLDDFIHVVDTLRWLQRSLAPTLHVQSKRTADGHLAHVVFQMVTEHSTAIGIMNRESGAVEETLESMTSGKKFRVTNVRDLVTYVGNQEQHNHTGDWTSVGEVRGFRPMMDTFLNGVRRMKQGDRAVWQEFRPIMQEDMATHRLCEEIVQRIEMNA